MYRTTIIAFLLIITGIVYDIYYPRPSVHAYNNYHSSAFQSPDHLDPQQPPNPDQYKQITLPDFKFYIQVPPISQTIKLTFRYKCEPECPPLWIQMDTREGLIPTKFLISHPVFQHLNWFPIYQDNLYLYQRQLTYHSISEFIQDPPPKTILTEQGILQAKNLHAPQISFLEDQVTLQDTDFILSTYKPPRIANGWSLYSRGLNILPAQRNSQGLITLHILTQSLDPNLKIFMTVPEVEHQ